MAYYPSGAADTSCVGAQIFVLLDTWSVIACIAPAYPTFSRASRTGGLNECRG
jgi:hypothetical protein